jgi:diguanylate cyclase (GGDEF)-like protein
MEPGARALRPLAIPLAVLAVAALAIWAGPRLPPTLAGLRTLGPYLLLAAAAGVALWFNRGRAFVAALSMLAGYAGYRYALELAPASVAARTAYLAVVILVPLNVLAAHLLAERGVAHHGAWRWLLLVAVETAAIGWLLHAAASPLAAPGRDWDSVLGHWALREPLVPLAGRIALAAALAAVAWRAWPRLAEQGQAPLEIGVAGALVGFYIACSWPREEAVFGGFLSAAGAILLVAVLQESHRLAFRDELTGLPSRRALEERLRALGEHYTVAMADVDHFKGFNDTWGHDVGDQVLKMVAARLAAVSGGGRAFRYGGEEFTLLFPDTRLKDALPHLEAVRAAVEGYQLAVRGADRPKSEKQGSRRRSGARAPRSVSVTISIGAAARGPQHASAQEVIKAADEALYRAKKGGRNRVSR